jgi:hypothetical protein
MIRVSLTVLIFIYLFLFLSAVFAVWISYELGRKRREKQALKFRIRCGICALDFEDDTSTLLPRCPRCGSLNERYKFRPL